MSLTSNSLGGGNVCFCLGDTPFAFSDFRQYAGRQLTMSTHRKQVVPLSFKPLDLGFGASRAPVNAALTFGTCHTSPG